MARPDDDRRGAVMDAEESTEEVTTADAEAVKPGARDLSLDTMAGVLIILVVIGHAIEPLEGRMSEALLQWIFLFHMPAFVFLSGYLTRWASTTSARALAERLLFPFVVFELLHFALASIVSPDPTGISPLTPAWTLWYLVALFVWRLGAPWISRIPAAVTLAACAALLAGTVDVIGEELSLSRIIGFLPFFAAGLLWQDEWWDRVRTPGMRAAAALSFVVAFAWSWSSHADVDRSALFLSSSYGDLGVIDAAGIAQRAGVLAVGGLLTVALMAFSGPVSGRLASVGAATLSVYLLHPLVLMPSHERGFPEGWSEAVLLPALIVGSITFAWLASRPRVVAATRPLMDLRWWRERLGQRA
ncbi:acyltransferase family protein [Demequina sp. NBRC 110053]|uniref:acyltransferase family protein n=1 Tax=Demequina sp. NBRC 110053 TaxID=1570342 RepID=UPI000A01E8F8|nr:acyltransferase family protein [Demequina sp. NBRC 110053]